MAACVGNAQALDNGELAFEGQNYRVVHIDLKHEQLGLYWRNPQDGQPFGSIESLRQWGEARGRRLLFAANAG
ncbi:MAG: hypothetical protein EPN69_06390, partial [Rhodanobacter sp.]